MTAIDFPNSPTVNQTFTAGNSTYKWTGVAWVSNNLGSIAWTDVTGKPTTFAPSAHTHVKTDITDFAHTHVKADVTDFAHTHPTSEVTGLDTALAGKQAVVSGVSDTEISYLDGVTSAIQTQINGKAATVHTHTISQVTDYVAPAQPPHPFLTMGA